MRIGKLRHLVTLQSKSQTRGDGGEVISVWADVASVWAEIKPSGGGQYLAVDAEKAEISVDIRIRRTIVSASDRVVHGSDVYEILAVLDYESNRSDIILKAKKLM